LTVLYVQVKEEVPPEEDQTARVFLVIRTARRDELLSH
jgi:hypothetical protein